MDPEELLIEQMGLLLTQIRHVRRSIESIERSTDRYSSFSFAQAFQSKGEFGAPPMMNGALKVYIVNINDLAPGQGIGGFLEGLLGGVGRFFGSFIGGLAGGILGGVALPYILFLIGDIAESINSILTRLGIGTSESATNTEDPESTSSSEAMNWPVTLAQLRPVIDSLTGLFSAASTGSENTNNESQNSNTTTANAWTETLRVVNEMLQGISHVINGLIILVPILIGSFAMFLSRLDHIKLAIIDMLQFGLRISLLLRGVILVTLFDTLSAAANLAANVLGILSTAVQSILGAIFSVIGTLLDAALSGLRFISDGVRQTIDALLPWLLSTVGDVLLFLGDTRVFKLMHYLVRALPNILPSLVLLVRDTEITPAQSTSLETAANLTMLPSQFPPGSATPSLDPFPDIADRLIPADGASQIRSIVEDTGELLQNELQGVTGSMQGALRQIGSNLNDGTFNSNLESRLQEVRDRADTLAGSLNSAREAAQADTVTANQPTSGLLAVATAYEEWLTGGGLSALIDRINEHFQSESTSGEAARNGLAGRITGESQIDTPRAIVEIDEVIIEIEPPPRVTIEENQQSALLNSSTIGNLLAEYFHDQSQRGVEILNIEEQGLLT